MNRTGTPSVCGNAADAAPDTGLRGGRLLVFESLDSTNRWLLDHAAQCTPGDVVWARRQTAGRGRFERAWHSPADRCLTISALIAAELVPPSLHPALAPAAALAVHSLLADYGLSGALKWPNDVLVGERKVAGILAEQASHDAVVLGIGINVNATAADLAIPDLLHPATSMRIETNREVPPAEALRRLLPRLDQALARLAGHGAGLMWSAWREHDLLPGRRVVVHTPRGEFVGACRGVLDDGRLLIVDADGQEHRFWSGDVTLHAPRLA